jgi:hypothetical protein
MFRSGALTSRPAPESSSGPPPEDATAGISPTPDAVDGIVLNAFGNPAEYTILKQHAGAGTGIPNCGQLRGNCGDRYQWP